MRQWSSRTSTSLSGPTWSWRAVCSRARRRAARRPGSTPSPDRSVTASITGSAPAAVPMTTERFWTNANVASSAHWRSSTTSSTGRRDAARWTALTARTNCCEADAPHGDGGVWSAASASEPPGIPASSGPAARNGTSMPSSAEPQAARQPVARAWSVSVRNSRVLPIPGGPLTITIRGDPATAWDSHRPRAVRSSRRPMRSSGRVATPTRAVFPIQYGRITVVSDRGRR
jgi:hypothetical protein